MDDDARYERGRALIREVWGADEGDRILDRWRELSPELEHQIVEAMFGDRWAKRSPDLKTRSLVHVAALTALGRATQLRVHLVGALRNGATEQEIVETILQVGLLAGFPTSWDALAVCKDVFAEQRRRGGDLI